jgi:hypothetical protein
MQQLVVRLLKISFLWVTDNLSERTAYLYLTLKATASKDSDWAKHWQIAEYVFDPRRATEFLIFIASRPAVGAHPALYTG